MMCDEKTALFSDEERPSAHGRRASGNSLNGQAQKRLGIHLRAMYESVLQQPIPDRFKDLITRLDETEGGAEQ